MPGICSLTMRAASSFLAGGGLGLHAKGGGKQGDEKEGFDTHGAF
jgi:hypothetical protein